MSTTQSSVTGNLCDPGNEQALQVAIDLFNDTFRFGEDPILSFFFDIDAIKQLLDTPGCTGIKVFPALEDQLDPAKISITMVVSAHTVNHEESGDESPLFLPPPVCCPTPGQPLLTERTRKISHWAIKLMALLFKN